MFKSAKYFNAEQSLISATLNDDNILIVPIDPMNRHYLMLVNGDPENGVAPTLVADYAARVPTLAEVIATDLALTETIAELARKLEELTLLLDTNGVAVPPQGKAWATNRKAKRDEIVAGQ